MIDSDFDNYTRLFTGMVESCKNSLKRQINQDFFQQDFVNFQQGLRTIREAAVGAKVPEEWLAGVREFSEGQIQQLLDLNSNANVYNENIARLSGRVKDRLENDKFYKIYESRKELEMKLHETFKRFLERFFGCFGTFLHRFNSETQFVQNAGKVLAELSALGMPAEGGRESMAMSVSLSNASRLDQSIYAVSLLESLKTAGKPTVVRQEEMKLPEYVSKAFQDFGEYKFDEGLNPAKGTAVELRPAVRLSDGVLYQGFWDRGTQLQSGKGSALFQNGDFYEGYWLDGHPEVHGRIIRPKGFVYYGQIKMGKEHGKGTLLGPDGYQYTGYFDHGYRQGSGKEIVPMVGVYEGEFYKSRKHGFGKMMFENGSKFEGRFLEGKMSDFGTFSWPNGEVYKGQFCKGKKHGKGTYNYLDGRVYEGDFCDDYPHGFGKITEKDGASLESCWKKGVPVGGTLVSGDQQRMSLFWRESVIQAE